MAALGRMCGVGVVLCLVLGACSHSVGPELGDDARDELASPARLPVFPDEAVLCRLVLYESTPAAVSEVLGTPDHTHDSGSGSGYSGSFSYDYADGSSLFIGFFHGVFDTAMVDNASYPKCWNDTDMALVEQLRHLGQPDAGAD